MRHLEGFEKLGLSARDARVYTALLKQGVSSIRNISDATSINRGSVYESLKDLMAAGLVSFQQSNINKKYFAEDPTRILDLIKLKKEQLDELEATTKEIIPSLLPAAAHMPYANIKFYEDHEGVAVILRDVLKTVADTKNKEYYVISSKPLRSYLYKKFPHFTRQRIKLELFVKVIAVGEGGEETRVAERKWLPETEESQPASYVIIYGNKFATIALNNNMDPYGVVIEDEGVASMQRLAFQQIWGSLK